MGKANSSAPGDSGALGACEHQDQQRRGALAARLQCRSGAVMGWEAPGIQTKEEVDIVKRIF